MIAGEAAPQFCDFRCLLIRSDLLVFYGTGRTYPSIIVCAVHTDCGLHRTATVRTTLGFVRTRLWCPLLCST